MLKLPFSVSFLDGVKECGHVLSETPQPIGPTALHSLQVPSVGIDGPVEHFPFSPDDRRQWVLSLLQYYRPKHLLLIGLNLGWLQGLPSNRHNCYVNVFSFIHVSATNLQYASKASSMTRH